MWKLVRSLHERTFWSKEITLQERLSVIYVLIKIPTAINWISWYFSNVTFVIKKNPTTALDQTGLFGRGVRLPLTADAYCDKTKDVRNEEWIIIIKQKNARSFSFDYVSGTSYCTPQRCAFRYQALRYQSFRLHWLLKKHTPEKHCLPFWQSWHT